MKTLPWPLGLAALLLSPLVASAQPAATEQTRLTLDQAQELAAAHSPELSSAQHEVDATSGGVMQAGAWRNPELTTTVEDFRSRTRTTTATIGIPLELGGKRSARLSAAERAHDVAAAQLANTKAEVRSIPDLRPVVRSRIVGTPRRRWPSHPPERSYTAAWAERRRR